MSNNLKYNYSRTESKSRLRIAFIITFIFLIVEVLGGIFTNSLALLSDAGHMLTDVIAIGLSLFSMRLSEKPRTPEKTYGFYRAEILAAFINGATLVLIAIFIVYEAYKRLGNLPEIKSLEMLLIAIAGLTANGFSGFILSRSKEDSLNVKGAYLHVLGDILGSIGAISAGLIMYFTRWFYADIIVSLLICCLIAYSSIRLLKETINILMEGTPAGINFKDVEKALLSIPVVKSIHDLHIWTIASGKYILTGHLILNCEYTEEHINSTLKKAEQILEKDFQITHSTLQVETKECEQGENGII